MNIDFNAGKKINKISDDDEKEEIIEESSDEIVVEDTPSNKNNYDKSELKKKLVKVCGIIIIIFIIFLLIILVATLFTKKNYTYSDVEQIMKEVAEEARESNKKASDAHFEQMRHNIAKNRAMWAERINNIING